jgi:hypothetical protein
MSKTIKEQLTAQLAIREKADAKIKQLEQALAAQETLSNLVKGSPVFYEFGRGETRGKFAGVVVDVVDTDKGRVILVMKGEGVDVQVVRIKPQDVIAEFKDVQEAEAERNTTQPASFAAVYGAETAPQSAAADPLANLI